MGPVDFWKNGNGRRYVPALVILFVLSLGIMIGTVISRGVRAARSPVAPDATPLAVPTPAQLSNSFAAIADAVEPAVVNINTESNVRASRRRFRLPDDSPFGDFFDRFFGPFEAPQGSIPQRSLGSGVIVDKNGYIVTNYHVIMQGGEEKPVDRIRVQLFGGEKQYDAKIVGTDKDTDLAVIKIEPERELTTVRFGDSDAMRVGDWVLAVGSPFGLESTVTAGIVSAKGRNIEGGPSGQFKSFIQTDAAINPGNSGGPLVNLAGEVVGINTAIATTRGSYDGVGFAIPSNTARKVYNAIIKSGRVTRGSIGITFTNTKNPALLRSFGVDHGVVVSGIQSASPAEEAGMKVGDVIVAVNGQPIKNGDQLVSIISDTPVNEKVKIEFLRNGKRNTVAVQVGDRSKVFADLIGAARELGPEAGEEAGGKLGVKVRSLTPQQAEELSSGLHLDVGGRGVLVTEVRQGSFAFDLGIRERDVILEINHHPISSVEDFNETETALKPGADVLVLVAQRRGRAWTTLYLADTMR